MICGPLMMADRHCSLYISSIFTTHSHIYCTDVHSSVIISCILSSGAQGETASSLQLIPPSVKSPAQLRRGGEGRGGEGRGGEGRGGEGMRRGVQSTVYFTDKIRIE